MNTYKLNLPLLLLIIAITAGRNTEVHSIYNEILAGAKEEIDADDDEYDRNEDLFE